MKKIIIIHAYSTEPKHSLLLDPILPSGNYIKVMSTLTHGDMKTV